MYYGKKREWTKEFNELPEELRKKLQEKYERTEVTQRKELYVSKVVSLIQDAADFATEWDKRIEDVELDHVAYEEYGSIHSAFTLEVKGRETDEQYHRRLIERNEWDTKAEENDKREFERLKNKFSK